MPFLDYFKFSQTKPVQQDVIEELSQAEKSVFLSFDNSLLLVSGGIKNNVANGKFDWQELIYLQKNDEAQRISVPAKVAIAISNLKHRLEGGSDVSVSLPMESVFTKYISVPKNDFSEKLLQAEMKKYVPIPFSEMLFASNKVRETEKESSYFCVVVHKPLFDSYNTLFKNFGITPYFELSCFSLARLANTGVSMLVFIGEAESFIILVKDKVLIDFTLISINNEKILNDFAKKYDISFDDTQILLNNYFKNLNLSSKQTIEAGLHGNYLSLAREIFLAKELFASNHNIFIEKIAVTGINVNLLNKVLNEVSENQILIEDVTVNLNNSFDSRYTHHIGLAKRG